MSIQAMKMALEALEWSIPSQHDAAIFHRDAITALRAAITEAEKCKPVAWMHPSGGVLVTRTTGLEHSTFTIPLYTTPQPAIPAWQPIETPPQEWGSYLIWHPKYGMETLWFQLKDGGNDGRKAGNWYSEEGDDDYSCNARVTHWMPLPAAPKEMK